MKPSALSLIPLHHCRGARARHGEILQDSTTIHSAGRVKADQLFIVYFIYVGESIQTSARHLTKNGISSHSRCCIFFFSPCLPSFLPSCFAALFSLSLKYVWRHPRAYTLTHTLICTSNGVFTHCQSHLFSPQTFSFLS